MPDHDPADKIAKQVVADDVAKYGIGPGWQKLGAPSGRGFNRLAAGGLAVVLGVGSGVLMGLAVREPASTVLKAGTVPVHAIAAGEGPAPAFSQVQQQADLSGVLNAVGTPCAGLGTPFKTTLHVYFNLGAAQVTLKGGPTGFGTIAADGTFKTDSTEEAVDGKVEPGVGPFRTNVNFHEPGRLCPYVGELSSSVPLTLQRGAAPPLAWALGPLEGSARSPGSGINYPLLGLGFGTAVVGLAALMSTKPRTTEPLLGKTIG